MYELHYVIFLSNVSLHWKTVLAVRLIAVTCESLELCMQNLVHMWATYTLYGKDYFFKSAVTYVLTV
jgi:hypothetical protein